jgi:chromate transport protein ChrA
MKHVGVALLMNLLYQLVLIVCFGGLAIAATLLVPWLIWKIGKHLYRHIASTAAICAMFIWAALPWFVALLGTIIIIACAYMMVGRPAGQLEMDRTEG